MSSTLNNVMENFSALSLEDKEYASEQIKKILVEARREEIYKNYKISKKEHEEGKLKAYTDLNEMRQALNAN